MNINESSLSRVWQHFENPDRAVGILTAFRGEYTYEENVARNRSLAADIRRLGYGFFYVDGYWIENQGTEQERSVKEDSIFVVGQAADTDFKSRIHQLGNNYDQEAVIVKDASGTNIVFKDGTGSDLGRLSPGKLGTLYTKLRNNKKANTFVFTEERDDLGFVERLAKLAGIR
jgi:hypothetical protein